MTEKLQLLSINPQTNKPYTRTVSYLPTVLSGALIGDLLIHQHIRLDGKKVIVTSQETSNPLLEETLGLISEQEKTIKFWMQKLQNKRKDIEETINYTFIQKEILTVKTSFFNNKKYILDETKKTDYLLIMRAEVKATLSRIENEEKAQPKDQEELLLLFLIDAAKLLSILFTNNNEVKQIRKRLKKIKGSSLLNKEIQSAIDSIDALNAISGAFTL